MALMGGICVNMLQDSLVFSSDADAEPKVADTVKPDSASQKRKFEDMTDALMVVHNARAAADLLRDEAQHKSRMEM